MFSSIVNLPVLFGRIGFVTKSARILYIKMAPHNVLVHIPNVARFVAAKLAHNDPEARAETFAMFGEFCRNTKRERTRLIYFLRLGCFSIALISLKVSFNP